MRRTWMSLPRIVRLAATHFAQGAVLGWVFVFVLLRIEGLGLGALLAKDASGLVTALLFLQMGLTFGGAGMAAGVMTADGATAPPAREPRPAAARLFPKSQRKAAR